MKTVKNKPTISILLVLPNANIHRLNLGPIKISFREAPLTLTTLAALVPEELNADIVIIDENVQRIPFARHFDIVGISCLTGTSLRAYEIADIFRSNGSTIVLGGVHVTLRPEEASKHADAIIVGFAETTWPQFLKDFINNKIKSLYKSESVNVSNLPIPRRDLQKSLAYTIPNTVFATRGCRQACDFCTVASIPFGWHTRPISQVIDEIREIKSSRIVFNDVSLTEDRQYALELFKAMIPLKKKWGGLAKINIVEDDELLELMVRSGCIYLLIGFETLEKNALVGINKNFNSKINYHSAVEKLHKHGIIVQGCFILGLDHDDNNVFKRTVDAVNELKIDIPRFAIYTPYPGTKAFKRLKKENRILHQYWPHYDTQHVVFKPQNMTPEELDKGFRWTYQKTFSINSIARRTIYSKHFPITFLGNIAYRMYIRCIQNDKERIFDETTQNGGILCHM